MGVARKSRGLGACPVGSVKTNIGHTEAAAGVAGLIKVLLMMRHQTLAPSVLFGNLKESLDLGGLHLDVVSTARSWSAISGGARLAAVNSFGFGGTNVQVVVQEKSMISKPLSSASERGSGSVDAVKTPTPWKMSPSGDQALKLPQITRTPAGAMQLTNKKNQQSYKMTHQFNFGADIMSQLGLQSEVNILTRAVQKVGIESGLIGSKLGTMRPLGSVRNSPKVRSYTSSPMLKLPPIHGAKYMQVTNEIAANDTSNVGRDHVVLFTGQDAKSVVDSMVDTAGAFDTGGIPSLECLAYTSVFRRTLHKYRLAL